MQNDMLDAERMNIQPGGKQPVMQDTIHVLDGQVNQQYFQMDSQIGIGRKRSKYQRNEC